MVIRVDSTPISTVVICTDCPYWHAFAWTRADGWAAGARHEAIVHPTREQARKANQKYFSRHTKNVGSRPDA